MTFVPTSWLPGGYAGQTSRNMENGQVYECCCKPNIICMWADPWFYLNDVLLSNQFSLFAFLSHTLFYNYFSVVTGASEGIGRGYALEVTKHNIIALFC